MVSFGNLSETGSTRIPYYKLEQVDSRLEPVENQSFHFNCEDVIREMRDLTSREKEVAILIAGGLQNTEIAEKLFITQNTLKNHITNIFRKLNVTDRLQLITIIYKLKMENQAVAN
ncbi:response regulator transcription factor [Bacillus sp. BGMRC 2118]|nr:response regulator transcription factor [Bacillus sp. BGMRC 2118]